MKKEFLILRAPEGSEGPTGAGSNGDNAPGVEQPKTDVPPEEEDPDKAENKPKTDVPPEEDPNKAKKEPKTENKPEPEPEPENKTDVPPEEQDQMPFDGYVLEDGIAIFVMGPVVINNYNIVCPCLEDEDPDNDAPAE